MPLNGRIGFTLVMLSAFAIMVALALDYPPAARFLPLVIGIPGIALTICQLLVDIRELRRPSRARDKRRVHRPDESAVSARVDQLAGDRDQTGSVLAREIVLFAYFFGLVAGVVLFGFWLTLPVFMIVFFGVHERETWRFALSLAMAGTAVLYIVFDRMLSIVLHEGFITVAVREFFTQ